MFPLNSFQCFDMVSWSTGGEDIQLVKSAVPKITPFIAHRKLPLSQCATPSL